jgi:hypothetical protein
VGGEEKCGDAAGPVCEERMTTLPMCTVPSLCEGYRVYTEQETGWSQQQDLQIEKRSVTQQSEKAGNTVTST